MATPPIQLLLLGDSRSAQRAFDQLDRSARRSETGLDRVSRRMRDVGASMTRTITGPVALAAAGSVKAFGNFDSAMTQSLSIMGQVDEAMRTKMADTARSVSEDLNLSSAAAAESYFFLASAGLDAAQSVAAMPQVARFAKAGMFDLARATDLATDAQSALGLTVDDANQNLANMTRVTDVLSKANILANASIEQFSVALTNKAGAALRTVNKDVEEGVAVLAAFADQGTKGEEAGERLSIVLRDVTRAAEANAGEFAKLGIQVFDANGNLRNMADVVAAFERGLGGMSDAQKAATFDTLGLTRGVGDALRQLLGTSDAIRTYEGELRKAAGTTEEIANNQMEAFTEQLGQARQQIVNAGIDIGETLAPFVLKGAQAVGGFTSTIADLPEPMRNSAVATGLFLAALGPTLSIAGRAAPRVKQLADGMRQLNGYLTVGKVAGAGAAQGLGGTAAAVSGVSAVLPVLGGALALGAIALGQYAKQQVDAKRRVEDMTATLDEQTGAITENTRAHVANRLAQEGARDAANELGVSFSTVVDAAMGDAAAQRLLADRMRDVNSETSRQAAEHANAGREMQGAAHAGGALTAEQEVLARAAGTVTRAIAGESSVLEQATTEARRHAEETAESEGRLLDMAHALERGVEPQMARLVLRHQEGATAADGHTDATGEFAGAQEDAEEQVEEVTSALEAQADAHRAAVDPLFAAQRATQRLEQAQKDYSKAVGEHGPKSQEAEDALSDLVDQALTTEGALGDLQSAVDNGTVSQDKLRAAVQKLADLGLIPEDLVDQAVEDLQGFVPAAEAAGYAIGAGIGDGAAAGLYPKIEQLEATAALMVRRAVTAAKREAQIESPSKRFAREVGEPIGEGIAEGVDKAAGAVDRSVSGAIDLAARRRGATPGSAGRGGTAGGIRTEQLLEEIARLLRRGAANPVTVLARDHETGRSTGDDVVMALRTRAG